MFFTWNDEHSFIKADVEFIVRFACKAHTELYGEDADGERGVPRNVIDDVDIIEVSIDGISYEYDKLHKDIQNVVDTEISGIL